MFGGGGEEEEEEGGRRSPNKESIATATTSPNSSPRFLHHLLGLLLPPPKRRRPPPFPNPNLRIPNLLRLPLPLHPPLSPPQPQIPPTHFRCSSSASATSNPQPPQQCWFQRFLSDASADYDSRWVDAFHMSKPSFTLLLRLLSPSLQASIPSLPPNYTLAAALFRLAHGASYGPSGGGLGLTLPELVVLFMLEIVVGFGWISLPNCCGVLGFGKFGVDGELLGKDGALMVQALVDSEGRFLDVSAGWSSKLKPDTILHQSALFSGVDESRELLNGPPFELTDGNLIPQYILEFGHGGSFWRSYGKRSAFFPFVIVTGCLLHNFLIKCSEPLPDENAGRSKEGELPIYQGKMNESGQRIRDALASHLSRVSSCAAADGEGFASENMECW
ncbi:hypothetical protein CK203_074090 [Vitis vinifera]|uniref:DDE Tnp4 domain-containing protein n=1 Tax=Vitis vinifera TaxID=29760 RepID=A0A438E7R1_VITVI|nr:hypothetical protein CK203_074090 [Vitis vinifera]